METLEAFNKKPSTTLRPILVHIESDSMEKKLVSRLRRNSKILDAVVPVRRSGFKDESNAWWKNYWKQMPEYKNVDHGPFRSVYIHVKNEKDFDVLSTILEQKLFELWKKKGKIKGDWTERGKKGHNKGHWFPARNPSLNPVCFTGKPMMTPAYPVYIISKGRAQYNYTANMLDKMKVPYKLVVEPHEYELYASKIEKSKILVLPFKNLGQGSIPARNWVFEHSKKRGDKRHWILDDNLFWFLRRYDNKRIKVLCGNTFRAIEHFVDRYSNVALAGMNYRAFCVDTNQMPPFQLNTRIYSCILIDNSIPFRWRGKYNEDTDLSLRVLKAGLCTVLFNAFLCDKAATMVVSGGNTEEIYEKGSRREEFVKSLVKQHPDVVTLTKRFGRPHHLVNYAPFKNNKLLPVRGKGVTAKVDNFGMVLAPYTTVRTPLMSG